MILAVVPAYNEEKKIGRVVRDLFQHGFKVIVIDDGSVACTSKEAAASGAVVLKHKINRGQGAALQTGNDYALAQGAETVVHFDADGQFNPADIAPAVKLLQDQQLDVVLGSRFLDRRSQLPWLKRYVILPVGRLVNFLLTGVWLTDAHNGFRILSRQALEKIKITQDGMAHNTEILAQLKKQNLKFAETPVEVKYFEYGQGIRGGFKILVEWVVGLLIK